MNDLPIYQMNLVIENELDKIDEICDRLFFV